MQTVSTSVGNLKKKHLNTLAFVPGAICCLPPIKGTWKRHWKYDRILVHFLVCHTRVPSPSKQCITQHVSESTLKTSSCVCQSLTCTHDPVNVLRHMLSFRLPPTAAKYGSDGQTCGVDRLVSTGCRFHTTVLSIPPFFCFSKAGSRTARSSYCTTSLPFELDLPKIHILTSTRPSYWVSSSICTTILLLVLPFSTRICRSLLRKCVLGKRFCCHHHHHQHEVTASQRQGVQTKELRKGVRMSRSSKPAPSSKPSWCWRSSGQGTYILVCWKWLIYRLGCPDPPRMRFFVTTKIAKPF